MTSNNPFYYNLPAQPADFVGRWELVERIVTDVSKPRPDSWAAIGGRRFGKSSVLKAIEARLLERLANCAPRDLHILPFIVDLKGCETKTEQSIYACIVLRLHEALCKNLASSVDLPRTRLHKLVTSETETLSFYQFERTLEDVVRPAKENRCPLRLVLLLDEVEATTRFPWCETLFNNLRALIYDGPLGDTVRLVLTGSARVIQVRHAGSPLLNMVKIEHLRSFSTADIEQLIARGGAISNEAIAAVQTQSGGHPFIAQYLLHHLWDWNSGLAQATPAQVEQIAQQMCRERAADLHGWWEAIGEGGRRVYTLLTNANNWLDERTLLVEICGITQYPDLELDALCYHGLVVCDKSHQRYHVAGTLFRNWFLRTVAQVQDSKQSQIQVMAGYRIPMDIPLELTEQLQKGNVIAFVGAGLSIGAGLPGWYSLISGLAQRIGYQLPPAQWATGDALIDAAQAYINEQGLHSLVMFLKDKLDTTGKSPTAAHQALARLPISLTLTANYDNLLERAYREVSKRVHIVVRDSDIPFMRRGPDAVNIIKLYGDLDQPDTIVLARQQYEAFFLQRPQMIKLLETELGRSYVLYLGWSHSDPHFNLVFGELLNRFGEFMRAGYAVMFDLPAAQRKELERKHIRLVQLPANGDRTAQLAAWLHSLSPGEHGHSVFPEAPAE